MSLEALDVITLIGDTIAVRRPTRFAQVEVTPRGCLAAKFRDGSVIYVRVAHLGSTAPTRPTWPTAKTNGDRSIVELPGGTQSMRPSYFTGLLLALLGDVPQVRQATTYTGADLVGDEWTPYGLRIEFQDGTVAYVSVTRGSSDAGDDPELPLEYTEAEAVA